MQNAGLYEVQAGIKIAGRNIKNHRYADGNTLWQTVKRNERVSSERGGLKLNIQKTKVMYIHVTSFCVDKYFRFIWVDI